MRVSSSCAERERESGEYIAGTARATATATGERDDIDDALAAGLLPVPHAVPEGVRLEGKVLHFDPKLAPSKRALLVYAILAQLEARSAQ